MKEFLEETLQEYLRICTIQFFKDVLEKSLKVFSEEFLTEFWEKLKQLLE